MKTRFIIMVLMPFLLFGCYKKAITQKRLQGNWKFSEYTYVEINEEPADSAESFSLTVDQEGYLNLDIEGNGTANWPIKQDYDPASIYYNDSLPAMYESGVQIVITPDSKRYNGKDYAIATVLGKDVAFKLLSKNKLSLIIFGGSAWNKENRYTRITLTK